jgi:cysteine desulfurase
MKIYLDNASTTKIDPRVFERMTPFFCDVYGNANSLHSFGREADRAVRVAREQVSTALGAKPNEIYFCSGGTESCNWALKGVARKFGRAGAHIIVSKIEHAAVLSSAKVLEKSGFDVTYLNVGKDGLISLDELSAAITDKTVLVSIMSANNEIGVLQPAKEIAKLTKKRNVLFHTDAVQAFGSIELNVGDLGADLVSVSAHKIHAPKGIGALYIRNGLVPEKLITGGNQERTMRGGTTNVPAAVGFGFAAEIAVSELSQNTKKIRELRDSFCERLQHRIPHTVLNGHPSIRLSGNCNFTFKGIEGESIMQMLDMAGIAVSTGSACSSGSLEPSHVLLALGVPLEYAHGSIRFSFGKYNTLEETDYVLEKLEKAVKTLREMSPLKINDN